MKKDKKRKQVFVSNVLDKPVLHFLWTWKIATTACIARRFGAEFKWTYENTYKRLWRMRTRGLVDLRYNDWSNGMVWELTGAGFAAIRNRLPELAEEGFSSENIGHDLFVQAAHLGEWLPRHSAPDVGLVTEQQLRRTKPDLLPNWIPKSTLHRPDGYWLLPADGERTLVALEVELSRKSDENFASTASFYARERAVHSVLWIVNGRGLAQKILAQCKIVSAYRDIHNFVDLEDLTVNGWDSVIFHGPNGGQKISAFLNRGRRNFDGTTMEQSRKSSSIGAILDSALKRITTRPCVQVAGAGIS